MKTRFIFFLFCSTLASVLKGQTNVSGGIYSNTIWTKVNSPYIVTDTVVVFPGVVLTIQPGVKVKFVNGIILEIRQGKLIANGTAADSITFTSSSSSPYPGIYPDIILNGGSLPHTFGYCNFMYANYGIINNSGSLSIKNSNFNNNNVGIGGWTAGYTIIDSSNFINNGYGLYGINYVRMNYCNISHNQIGWQMCYWDTIMHCVIDSNQTGINDFRESVIYNSSISHNQSGIIDAIEGGNIIKYCTIESNSTEGIQTHDPDSILSCIINNNGIGINVSDYQVIIGNNIEYNSIGIKLSSSVGTISCNSICNSSTGYDLEYTLASNTSIAANNYWCTNDSASTSVVIYDGYDNINLGLVFFMPLDTSCHPPVNPNPTSISEAVISEFNIYPNPTNGQLKIYGEKRISAVEVLNLLGEKIIETAYGEIDLSSHKNGLYFIRLTYDGRQTMKKIVLAK